MKKQAKFNWHNINNNKVTILTAQFLFIYDQQKNLFRIRNDASRCTESVLSWNHLADYEVYGYSLRDIKYLDLKTKKQEVLINQLDFPFDVTPQGEFVSNFFKTQFIHS